MTLHLSTSTIKLLYASLVYVQINFGVLNFMDDERGPEKLVVILDCRGATAMQVGMAAHHLHAHILLHVASDCKSVVPDQEFLTG